MAKLRSEQRDLGRAVLERLASDKAVPAPLKPLIKAFSAQQKGVEAASKEVEAARATRDAALDLVGARDAALDKQVDVLANKLVGAELGPRKNPFAPFGGRAPSALKEIAYTTEVVEVLALVAAIKKKKPPKPVTAALVEITTLANASKKALIALVAPQTAYVEAIASRDELLVEWTRAFERLRAHAKAVWIDTPGTYAAIFAPPGLEARHPAKRKSKPAPPPASAGAPPPAPPQPPLPFGPA